MQLSSVSPGALLVAVLALAAGLAAGAPMFTNDAFWHVTSGCYVLEHGLWPGADPFSFSATAERWVLHEWLTQVVFHVVHEHFGGMYGLRVLTALLAVAAVALVARLARRSLAGSWVGAAVVVALFLALGCWRFQTRPTAFTIVALLLLVDRLVRPTPFGTRAAIGVGLLQLVWFNLHSVALVGVVLQVAHGLGRGLEARLARRRTGVVGGAFSAPAAGELRSRALALGLSIVASFCTPAGAHLWAFAWQDKSSVMQYVDDEWGRFHFVWSDNAALPFATYVGVLVGTAVLAIAYLLVGVALNRSADRLRDAALPAPSRVLLMLALFAGGLMARRFHWFVALSSLFALELAVQCVTAGHVPRLRAAVTRRPIARTARLVGGVAVLVLAFVVPRADTRGALVAAATNHHDYWRRPIVGSFELDGVAFLEATGIEGNVVCHYGSGGLLSYALYPAVRVFIDSRIDLYRRGIYLDYLAVRAGRPDSQRVLDAYGADVYYRHWGLPAPVDAGAWQQVWSNPAGTEAVYLRRGAERTPRNLERAAAHAAAHAASAPPAGR